MANLLLLKRNQISTSHLASPISILKQLTVAITIALALSSTHLLLASPAFDFTRPSIGNGAACFSPDMGLALVSQIVDPPIRCWFKSPPTAELAALAYKRIYILEQVSKSRLDPTLSYVTRRFQWAQPAFTYKGPDKRLAARRVSISRSRLCVDVRCTTLLQR